jgi:zinc transport system substrate-binding protein
MSHTRRTFLSAAVGVVGLGAIAGCQGSSAEQSTDIAQSSFFVFGDIASEVAGDAATTELLVPVGQHGHGWEPGPRVREDIYETELLVHGMTGFQPWVDTILNDLDADGADVATVDASADVDLLAAGGDHGEHHTGEEHHDEGTHTGEHHGDEETHTDEHHDEETHTGDHEEGGHDEHDHGSMDPHFWMDPLRMKDAVGTVERALTDVDGENADSYADNAQAYRDRLDDLHARMDSMVADASTETVLVAGHDSFSYVGDRYGVTVRALTGLSPDDQPTTRDIQQAREIVAEHDLQYICADPLESQQAAEQLVAETDAEAVLPLTAMPGLTETWASNDWGYVEVMENVNLPTLERALDA